MRGVSNVKFILLGRYRFMDRKRWILKRKDILGKGEVGIVLI